MAKPQHQPFRGFLDLMGQMERMRSLARTGESVAGVSRTEATAWVPTADVFVRGSDFVVTIELAGVPPAAIDIEVSQGVLTVSGERPAEAAAGTASEVSALAQERYFGAFRRSFMLPAGVDEERITAGFDLGVVTITVPGATELEPRRAHRIQLQEGRPT
jgi:HSP20 family protein